MPTARRVLSAAALLPFLLVATPPELHATTTFHITTTADDVAANGNCTLREAVIAANTDTAVDRCPAGSGADIIVLRGGTYTLTVTGASEDAAHTGDLDIVASLTIRGAGAGATILDGGSFEDHPDRVLHVLTGATVAVSGVTIRGGLCGAGGGILNRGTLTVTDSVLRDNIVNEIVPCGPVGGGGAAIYNSGTLEVVRSSLTDNSVHGTWGPDDVAYPGGGLLNRGTAIIRETVITDNFAAAGGGISNSGSLEVFDTEISRNFARFWAAGLDNAIGSSALTRVTVAENGDGGIMNGGYNGTSAFLALQDSTVSGNRAYRVPGAIFNFGGSIYVNGSTIANNESYAFTPCPDGPPCPLPVAGIAAQAYLTNTILSNPGYRNCGTPAISWGHNVDSDGSCGLNAAYGDLPGANPQLRPLADNGGPTRTHALRNASPAIDHVPAGQCTETDQRGVTRPQPPGGACDIGAYEFAPDADLRFLIGDVQDLDDLLTAGQLLELLQPLKIALADLSAGRTAHACEMLDVFIATVSKYAGGGVLSVDTAKALMATAGRIKTMICR